MGFAVVTRGTKYWQPAGIFWWFVCSVVFKYASSSHEHKSWWRVQIACEYVIRRNDHQHLLVILTKNVTDVHHPDDCRWGGGEMYVSHSTRRSPHGGRKYKRRSEGNEKIWWVSSGRDHVPPPWALSDSQGWYVLAWYIPCCAASRNIVIGQWLIGGYMPGYSGTAVETSAFRSSSYEGLGYLRKWREPRPLTPMDSNTSLSCLKMSLGFWAASHVDRSETGQLQGGGHSVSREPPSPASGNHRVHCYGQLNLMPWTSAISLHASLQPSGLVARRASALCSSERPHSRHGTKQLAEGLAVISRREHLQRTPPRQTWKRL